MLVFPKRRIALLTGILGLVVARTLLADPWSFGVMSDTQWSPSEGHADKGVPTEIIDDVNKEFVKAGVKFVIQVGDITQNAGKKANSLDELDIRARHNAALTAAGIRYFALRGNHEGSPEASVHFGDVFTDLPGTAGFKPGDGYGGGSSPDLPGLAGRSYSFTYNNAKFVLLDQFLVADGSAKGKAYPIYEQLPWIAQQLAQAKAAQQHAFVFAHKNLLGQHHKDNLFGDALDARTDPGDASPARQAVELAFIRALQENGVRLYMSGHDHMYYRSMVSSPDAAHSFSVQQVITGSCSYKFYEPLLPYSANEQPIVHERNAVGYNIVTIDGPRVIFRYYSAPVDVFSGYQRGEISKWKTPSAWTLQDEFGYSINGKQCIVKKDDALSAVHDEIAANGVFVGTKMAIIGGTNQASGTTLDDRPEDRRDLAANVTTGWSARPSVACASDVLSLWGLRLKLGAQQTSTYVLSMSYDAKATEAQSGSVVICGRNAKGQWVNAAALNHDGAMIAARGPYKAGYALGSYGLNTDDHTAWVVLDHEGDFVVSLPEK